MSTPGPSSTEWVVIRPAGEVEFSSLADVFDGEWRRRSELASQDVIETLSPDGTVRAYPTSRIERTRDGQRAQVYEVPEDLSDAE